SFGPAWATTETRLIGPAEPAKILIPTESGQIPADWTDPAMDDSAWTPAAMPIGYGNDVQEPTEPVPFDPTQIAGSVLWLDGDDVNGDGQSDPGVTPVAMTTWTDKSSGQGDNSVAVPATNGGAPLQYFDTINGRGA